MDICDAQFHIAAGGVDTTLAAMDAVGITSVLIDEFWFDPADYAQGVLSPGYRLANGAWRSVAPTAELASILHPDRFSYFVRLDRQDPDLEMLMRLLGSSPHVRAFRLLATWTPEETEVFATGGYDELFDIPGLSFVVDHCGLVPVDRAASIPQPDGPLAYFDEVLAVAEHPNVALKWGHAQRHFDAPDYPYEPVRPYLRRAIEAFGADRLLWTSDASVMFGHTWSDLMHSIRDDRELSQDEKEWILGRTFRRTFDWPAPSAASTA
jgi:L-fuconolactonase